MYRLGKIPWLLLALYATLGLALFVWTQRSVEESADALARATAALLGAELSRGIDALAIGDLADLEDRGARFELYSAVAGLAARGALVESVEVIDRDGVVAVADPAATIGERRRVPDTLFAGDRSPRLGRPDAGAVDEPIYEVEMPLVRQGAIVGSLRVRLDSAPFDRLYADARQRLASFAGAVFAVLVVLALLLHLELRRRGQRVSSALESALAGERLEPGVLGDPFAPVIATASRMGLELLDARERSSELENDLQRLASLLEVGIVVIDSDGSVRFSSPPARALIEERHLADFVASVRQRLHDGDHSFVAAIGDTEVAVQGDHAEDGGFVVILRRAESTRSLETDLRLAAQLRSMMRLYRGVAHDLKAPLNALVLNLELLRRSVEPRREPTEELRESQREWIGVVSSEIERLRRGLESLLAQSAPPASATTEIELGALVADLRLLLEPQGRQQGVAIEVEAASEAVYVVGYPDQLRQAILNLAVNALETMPDGGSLTLAVRTEVRCAVVAVSDTGGGVEEAIRDRLFQMHATTKSTGTGIGLYTTQAIAAAMGGAVRLAHTGPGGSCFELELPRSA